MRLLARLPLRAAQVFCDYLATLQIAASWVEQGAQAQVWVDELHYEQALQELNAFAHNPHHEKYRQASWQTSQVAARSSLLINQLFRLGTPLVMAVAVACVVIFFSFYLGTFEFWRSQLLFSPTEPWRWLTPAFLHFSELHVLFNVAIWWRLGSNIERAQGAFRLTVLFVLTAIASSWLQYWYLGPGFGGLSGVVFGVIGYCWWQGRLGVSAVAVPDPLLYFSLLWLALGFAEWLPINMANFAHFGGLLAGVAVAQLFARSASHAQH